MRNTRNKQWWKAGKLTMGKMQRDPKWYKIFISTILE